MEDVHVISTLVNKSIYYYIQTMVLSSIYYSVIVITSKINIYFY